MIKLNDRPVTNKFWKNAGVNLDLCELVAYETPTVADFIPWEPLQRLFGKYIAWRVRRKLNRLQKRRNREDYLRRKGLI